MLSNGNGNGEGRAHQGNGYGDGLAKFGNGNGNGGSHAQGLAPAAGASAGTKVSPTAVVGRAKAAADELLSQYKLKCPDCGSGTLAFIEGCVKCAACGYSKC